MHRLALLLLLAVASPAVAATPPAAPSVTVTLKTADGLAIKAYEQGKGTNGIVLVHDKGASADDWSYLSGKLASHGYHVLAVNLRGHGNSVPPNSLVDADYPKMIQDVQASVEYLKAKGATKISVVGAQFGADLAVNAAALEPSVTNLILLTPDLNVNGVLTAAAMEKYGNRPVLLVASSDDGYGVRSVNTLDDRATGDKHVELLDSAGKGATMLNRDADLEGLVFSWLNGTYHLQDDEKASAHANVNTGDASSIKTTGTKFGDKNQ